VIYMHAMIIPSLKRGDNGNSKTTTIKLVS
jgi:hypothetical protein